MEVWHTICLAVLLTAAPATTLESVVYTPSQTETNDTSLAVVISYATSAANISRIATPTTAKAKLGTISLAPQANSNNAAPKVSISNAAPLARTNSPAPQVSASYVAPLVNTSYAAPQASNSYAPQQPAASNSYAPPQPAASNSYAQPQPATSNSYAPPQPATSNAVASYGYVAPPQTGNSYSAPSASTGYATPPEANRINDNYYDPQASNSYYNYPPQDGTGYAGYAAAEPYAEDPQAGGYYDGYYSTDYPLTGDGYYTDPARQETAVAADPNAAVAETGTGASKEEMGDHTADLLRQLLLFVVAIVAILYGFFVTPFIVSGLGFASGLLPLIVTAFSPSANFFLGLAGLSLCTVGPPPALFPGGTSVGRQLDGAEAAIAAGLTPAEAVQQLVEKFYSLWP